MFAEDTSIEGEGLDSGVAVDIQAMDGHLTQDDHERPMAHKKDKECHVAPSISRRTPYHEAHQTNGMHLAGKAARMRHIFSRCKHCHGIMETRN